MANKTREDAIRQAKGLLAKINHASTPIPEKETAQGILDKLRAKWNLSDGDILLNHDPGPQPNPYDNIKSEAQKQKVSVEEALRQFREAFNKHKPNDPYAKRKSSEDWADMFSESFFNSGFFDRDANWHRTKPETEYDPRTHRPKEEPKTECPCPLCRFKNGKPVHRSKLTLDTQKKINIILANLPNWVLIHYLKCEMYMEPPEVAFLGKYWDALCLNYTPGQKKHQFNPRVDPDFNEPKDFRSTRAQHFGDNLEIKWEDICDCIGCRVKTARPLFYGELPKLRRFLDIAWDKENIPNAKRENLWIKLIGDIQNQKAVPDFEYCFNPQNPKNK